MSKETQNKWEEEFQMKYCGELYKQEVSEDFRGFRSCYQEVKDFISQEIEKSYQKGVQDGKDDIGWINKEVEQTAYQEGLGDKKMVIKETLEEVEMVFLKHYIGKNFKDLESVYELEPIVKDLQKLKNKMKTK